MKWIKHMTASADDEKMASLIGEGGADGLALYGAYWRFAEIVAAQMEGKTPSCSVTYPLSKWAKMLSVRKSYLTSTLLRLQKERLLVVELCTNESQSVTVAMPNLLKYRDEYSRKSGHTPDNVAPDTEGDTEGEKEVKKKEPAPKKTSAPTLPDFVNPELWTGFVEVRRKMRNAPFTERAERGIIADLCKLKEMGIDPNERLHRAMTSGWRGVLFPEDKQRSPLFAVAPKPKTQYELDAEAQREERRLAVDARKAAIQ